MPYSAKPWQAAPAGITAVLSSLVVGKAEFSDGGTTYTCEKERERNVDRGRELQPPPALEVTENQARKPKSTEMIAITKNTAAE
jgi:hypothetical protein